jgi:hypothetical protein
MARGTSVFYYLFPAYENLAVRKTKVNHDKKGLTKIFLYYKMCNQMKNILVVIFFTITTVVFANDGGIQIIGNDIHPVNIANVSMDYERLNITCKENVFELEAYIELFNHEKTSIKPLLGFEFYEGMLSEFTNLNLFKQYILLVNNEAQKFEYKIMRDPYTAHTLVYSPQLKPGKNTVYHKIQLPYGFGSFEGVVSYILMTSSRWKDGVIKNLEIFIRTEKSTIILFEERLPDKIVSSFNTIGESKLYKNANYERTNYEYYSLTPNGYLYKNIQNFIPDRNINFQLLNFCGMEMYIYYDDPPYNWPRDNSFIVIYDWKRYIEDNNFTRYRWHNWLPSEKMLNDLNVIELRILRNTLYAIHGYVFNDKFLNDYFSRQYWYFPNPNMSQNDIKLGIAERKILEYIVAEENKRR